MNIFNSYNNTARSWRNKCTGAFLCPGCHVEWTQGSRGEGMVAAGWVLRVSLLSFGDRLKQCPSNPGAEPLKGDPTHSTCEAKGQQRRKRGNAPPAKLSAQVMPPAPAAATQNSAETLLLSLLAEARRFSANVMPLLPSPKTHLHCAGSLPVPVRPPLRCPLLWGASGGAKGTVVLQVRPALRTQLRSLLLLCAWKTQP